MMLRKLQKTLNASLRMHKWQTDKKNQMRFQKSAHNHYASLSNYFYTMEQKAAYDRSLTSSIPMITRFLLLGR